MAPLGSIGDEKTYTGPLALDVLKFIGILVACWSLGTFLIAARFGIRISLQIRPFRAAVVSRPGTGPATTVGRTRVPRPTHDRATAASTTQQDGLVAEAARLLRTGSKQHHVDKILEIAVSDSWIEAASLPKPRNSAKGLLQGWVTPDLAC
ncbi:hypothetical protein ABTZ21_32955 [Streptomyces sp. NPDC096191]|uniref:hypothetical protein n=1 Tax=Streptomyces sp. NPDC096191 TaxID=3155426 RepID=UPI003317556B